MSIQTEHERLLEEGNLLEMREEENLPEKREEE